MEDKWIVNRLKFIKGNNKANVGYNLQDGTSICILARHELCALLCELLMIDHLTEMTDSINIFGLDEKLQMLDVIQVEVLRLYGQRVG